MTGIVANPKNLLHIVKKKNNNPDQYKFKAELLGPVIEDNIGENFLEAIELVNNDLNNEGSDFFGFLCNEIKSDYDKMKEREGGVSDSLNTKILQLPLILKNIKESQKDFYSEKQKEKLLVSGFGDEMTNVHDHLYEICSQLHI